MISVHRPLVRIDGKNTVLPPDTLLPADAIPLSISADATGFPELTSSELVFDSAARRLYLQPTGASFTYSLRGVEYEVTAPMTVQVPATTGLYWFYIDAVSRTLQYMTAFDVSILKTHAFVAVGYYSVFHGGWIRRMEERHGFMPEAVHRYAHLAFGARWINGLGLSDITADGNGSLASHATVGMGNGMFADEDLFHSIVSGSPQALAGVLQAPVFYRYGASEFRRAEADDYPLIYNGKAGWAGTLPAYNVLTGSTWGLAEAENGRYILVHFIVTNDRFEPAIAMLGGQYQSISEARLAADSELIRLAEGWPWPEWIASATVIYQVSNTYANTPKARIRTTDQGGTHIDHRAKLSFPGRSAETSPTEVFVVGSEAELPVIDHPATGYVLAADGFYDDYLNVP